jgi:hypothetical protein
MGPCNSILVLSNEFGEQIIRTINRLTSGIVAGCTQDRWELQLIRLRPLDLSRHAIDAPYNSRITNIGTGTEGPR